jgi:cytoskeletal protein CcmA (bactofilin family)
MAKATPSESGTRIGPETTLRAKISGSEDLSVAGRLEGTLELLGTLTVEPTGVVKAEVTVMRAVVAGIVVGDIEATESIQIAPEGKVLGDLHAPRISIAEGARFSGTIEMGPVEAHKIPERDHRFVDAMRPEVVREPRRPAAPSPLAPIMPPLFGTPQPSPVLKVEEDDEASVSPASSGGSMRPKPMDGRKKRIVVKKRS